MKKLAKVAKVSMDINEYLNERLLQAYYTAPKVGLLNVGATCYINTLIQCLLSCHPFVALILDKEKYEGRLNNVIIDANGEEKKVINLILELQDIFDLMCIRGKSLRPIRFLKILKFKFPDMDVNQQNDLHEVLYRIIGKINEEIRIPTEDDVKELFDKEKLEAMTAINMRENVAIKCYKAWFNMHKAEYSEIVELMYGQLISQMKCGNCDYNHHNYDPFQIIETQIPNQFNVSLMDCLMHFVQGEMIHDWKCSNCNEVSNSQKVIRFWKCPPVLIILLKRFNFNMYNGRGMPIKNQTPVRIPLTLNLERFVLDNKSFMKYKLQSAAIHSGNAHGGHYFALSRSYTPTQSNAENNNMMKNDIGDVDDTGVMPEIQEGWTVINDHSIYQVKSEDELNRLLGMSYVLFYTSTVDDD